MVHSIKITGIIFFLIICQNTFSQNLKIGTIEIYGNRKVSANSILSHLGIKAGDSIKAATIKSGNLLKSIKKNPGVKYASVNPVCCDTSGNWMLFIGIGETDQYILKYRHSPQQNIHLPVEMIEAYDNFNNLLEDAIRSGKSGEDDSHGYSLINYDPARKEQLKFINFANQNASLLINVLKNSKYSKDRAAAAQIIAYSDNKKIVLKNLLYASNDPDDEVRNNSTRALGILAIYARSHPESKISIPAEPFIKMINSIVWSDRNKGSMVLMQLTGSRDTKILNQIRQQALSSIIEMAKWKDRSHAVEAFFILGRIAGIGEKELAETYNAPYWDKEIDKMLTKLVK